MSQRLKILICVFSLILIISSAVFTWFWLDKRTGKKIEIKGILMLIKGSPLRLNRECLEDDLMVNGYYLAGVCKKPYLAASLLDAVGKEVEVRGETKEYIIAGGTTPIIEIEEVSPPEIIIFSTDTDKYHLNEKITLSLKHYLKQSILSYFNSEKAGCLIKSIEKKNGQWQEIENRIQAENCSQVTSKEIKAYHLSGEAGIFEWQPSLEPGIYRIKLVYKLAGENEWKEISSNEFFILKPGETKSCRVSRGYHDEEVWKNFRKTIALGINWTDYQNFVLDDLSIKYGDLESDFPIPGEPALKAKTKEGKEIKNYFTFDPRMALVCASCPPEGECPPCESGFHKEGSSTLTIPYDEGTASLEFYEGNDADIPEDILPLLPPRPAGYKLDGKLLLSVDLSACLKEFCERVALEGDPLCQGEYYSTTVIRGRITDSQGNSLSRVPIVIFEKLTEEGCLSSAITDENGNYSFRECHQPPDIKLKEGLYDFSVEPQENRNLKAKNMEIEIKKGEEKVIDVLLNPWGSVTGRVTDKNGNPLTEAWVYEVGFETPHYHVCMEISNDSVYDFCKQLGAFIIPLDAGEYNIGAYALIDGKEVEFPRKKVKTELGKTTIVNFVLE